MTHYSTTIDFPKFRLAVEFDYSPGDPGQTSGPPERCWPPEPAEFDLTACRLFVLADPIVLELRQSHEPDSRWRDTGIDLYELDLIEELGIGDKIEDDCMSYLDALDEYDDPEPDDYSEPDHSNFADNGVR